MEATPFDRGSPESPADPRTAGGTADGAPSNRKALTIGAVAKILGREFEDISISKIRYLEDQKLLSPRRTRGGYRLYSQSDVERLDRFNCAGSYSIAQCFTVDELGRDELFRIDLIDFVNGENVRMVQSRSGTGFQLETAQTARVLREVRGQYL